MRALALALTRVQDPLGSFNVGWRVELGCGDVSNRADDNARRWAETAHGEKLKHERPLKGLPVSAVRDEGQGENVRFARVSLRDPIEAELGQPLADG